MLVETDAIVLHTIKYSETSVIAHIYTKEFGNGTYIMGGVRTNRSKMALFQPLSLVHITAYRKKDSQQIHRIATISFIYVPQSINSNIYKSTMALFIGEITDHTFREEEQMFDFFDFLKKFILVLDQREKEFVNLHVLYLLHLTKFLGFFHQQNFDKIHQLFSPLLGQFVEEETLTLMLNVEESHLLQKILSTTGLEDSIELTLKERNLLLDTLLKYYDVHICKTQNIKSLPILRMVFENDN